MLTCAVLVSGLFAAAPDPAQFFVAPNGHDEDPGTKEKPFATPTRAMAAVRALVAGGLKNDVRVVLRGGDSGFSAEGNFAKRVVTRGLTVWPVRSMIGHALDFRHLVFSGRHLQRQAPANGQAT